MAHPLVAGKYIRSYGGSFVYQIKGPCCRLYDRDELPWPSCSLVWRGKQPSWNRTGPRFVADMAANRCPSYSVVGWDRYGARWEEVVSLYYEPLTKAERRWWVWKGPNNLSPPATVDDMEARLDAGHNW
jgi:hypothetical protein